MDNLMDDFNYWQALTDDTDYEKWITEQSHLAMLNQDFEAEKEYNETEFEDSLTP
ncbi:MAG: hypothetical protein O7D95_02920 [Betaproteobacteria bacterium]|nr:hypothetical protein [Betaproteobacteria bacterium]